MGGRGGAGASDSLRTKYRQTYGLSTTPTLAATPSGYLIPFSECARPYSERLIVGLWISPRRRQHGHLTLYPSIVCIQRCELFEMTDDAATETGIVGEGESGFCFLATDGNDDVQTNVSRSRHNTGFPGVASLV